MPWEEVPGDGWLRGYLPPRVDGSWIDALCKSGNLLPCPDRGRISAFDTEESKMKNRTVRKCRWITWGLAVSLLATALGLLAYIRIEAAESGAPNVWFEENSGMVIWYILAVVATVTAILTGLLLETLAFIVHRKRSGSWAGLAFGGGAMVLALPLLMAASPAWLGAGLPGAGQDDAPPNPCAIGADCASCIFEWSIVSCWQCITGTWDCWTEGTHCQRACSKSWRKGRCVELCEEISSAPKPPIGVRFARSTLHFVTLPLGLPPVENACTLPKG